MIKVPEFNEESLKEMMKDKEKKSKPKILPPQYVAELNRGISYRIRERQASHAVSVEIAKKSIFD